MAGCAGLFLNLQPSFADTTADIRQGTLILAIARDAGVRHVVYAGGAISKLEDLPPPLTRDSVAAGFLRNKASIEDAVKDAGFESWTVLRPAWFMANCVPPKAAVMFRGLGESGVFETALREDTVLVSVDEGDVAAFAMAAFNGPERFGGREVWVASEKCTVGEILRELGGVAGRRLCARYMSDEEVVEKARAGDGIVQGQILARSSDGLWDLEEVRAWGIPLHSFREWLVREREVVKRTYGHLPEVSS